MAECEDDMNPELREQLDAFFDEQSLVDEVNAATLAATNPTDLEEFTSEDDTALDEEDSDVPLSFFVEPHKLHCSPDAEPGATHICDSSELYEAVFGEAVDPTRFALTIEHLQADDKNDVEWISHDLSQARLGLLRSLAVQVPLCDFTALVKALDTIQELGDFVSTVIALSQLAEVDAEAVINISERLPSDLWLFYTKWFLVVERICGQIPWFGDTRGLSFWMELDAACPTGQAQTELLNVFEALLDKEEKEMENHKSSDEEDTDSELEDGETQNSSGTQSDDASELSSTSTDNLSFNIDERVPYYSLEEFANYLNIFSGWVGIPNSIRDLPRLSRQERWWCRINSRCPGLFTPLLPDLRFAVEQFLYYVEYLESECGDMGGYAEKFIDQLVDDLVKSAVDPKAALSRVNELVQNLREVLMLPFRSKSELRRHLAELSSLTYRAEHPKDFLGDVENRTVQEVVDFLSDSSSFDENTLLSIQVAVEQVITSRNHPRRVMDDDSSTAFTLVQLDEVVFQVYGFYLYPVQLVAIVCATSASTSGADIEIAASILQMETGEGKSVTFAVIAAYYASRKMTVDIATSSDQLAIDGAADAEALFRKLGLSVGGTSIVIHRYSVSS
ncbi:Protein translocase subunit SecA [Phytophthora citrophthora]|uniref:Protein translocase subunit SecA n=1 Tax=Phytophthora citrophthora TaxID=4793 RepID=A0AAD9G5R8_9STRA|nr:Protein translocase subunit SecA [Phytophthora citrophthora]